MSVPRRPPAGRKRQDNWRDELAHSLTDGSLMKIVISRGTTLANSGGLKKVVVTPLGDQRFQIDEQGAGTIATPETSADGVLARIDQLVPLYLLNIYVFTKSFDLKVAFHPERPLKVRKQKPSMGHGEPTGEDSPAEDLAKTPASDALPHNRVKNYLLAEGTPIPFLVATGVMTSTGVVRPTMYHKFRQINRYLEFVNDIYTKLPAEGVLRVVDFGCGKSYLTFAVHHLLHHIHRRDVQIIGLDIKPNVIADCQKLAETIGASGLSFELGRIESYSPKGEVHFAISLHACDTATDAALLGAVRWGARVILAVPCCQHELAPQLENPAWNAALSHGFLRDKLATLVTDSLRAAWLETQGYKTQVLEFIELEHTPKNVLLRAVKRVPRDQAAEDRHASELVSLIKATGVTTFSLLKQPEGENSQ